MSQLQQIKDHYLSNLLEEAMTPHEKAVSQMTEEQFAQLISSNPRAIHHLLQKLTQSKVQRTIQQRREQARNQVTPEVPPEPQP